MNRLIIIVLVVFSTNNMFAHEPIYGLGPETLPKHLHAIELGTVLNLDQLEYNLGYGFGVTQNWTIRIDFSASSNNSGDFELNRTNVRTKYALWRDTAPGVLKRLTAIAVLSVPNTTNTQPFANITAATIGIANGYESRRWYYFSDIGYTHSWANPNDNIGAKLKYNLVGGIRPIQSGYLQPDLVILVELNGELSGKSTFGNTNQELNGGNTLALAPGFLLSYRNIMLKGGVQFGIAKSKRVQKINSNGLLSLEYHF